jgi:hypothetical protein
MYKGIGNAMPWLILAGSGGVAHILVTLMNRGCWDMDSVQELLLDTFPSVHHSTDITNWTKLVRSIEREQRERAERESRVREQSERAERG